jgi:hypothetical protein
VGLALVITLLGYYVVPPLVFVTPGYSVYATGIVDHKSIGQGYSDAQPLTWYTVSVRLFDDDPINRVHSGETLAYIVTKAEWSMIEWGDTVKIRILQNLRAQIVELYPSLKLPEWRAPFLGGLRLELTADKAAYRAGEEANFTVKISSVTQLLPGETTWQGTITLLDTFAFWVFKDGYTVFSASDDSGTHEVALNPGQELKSSFQWDLGNISNGIYYVRVYFGYFTGKQENTLTGTTMIEIES